jgi:hypothetical protein
MTTIAGIPLQRVIGGSRITDAGRIPLEIHLGLMLLQISAKDRNEPEASLTESGA